MTKKTPITVRKCIVFALVAVLAIWLGLDFSLFCCLWLRPKRPKEDESELLYRAHPYRAFAPVPGMTSRKGDVSFNSLGIRGPEIRPAKPPNAIRIVCMGGSTTFGTAATTDSHAVPARMEQLLRARYADAPFRIEVINAGVSASVSLESLIYFETEILNLSPDIVVFHDVLNDGWLMVRCLGFQSDYSNARRTLTIPRPALWEYSPFLSYFFAESSLSNPYGFGRAASLADLVFTQPMLYWDYRRGTWNELDRTMLASFERNLRSAVYVARGNGVIPVFATAVIVPYGPENPSGHLMHRAVEDLNRVMRDTATSESVPVIDVARMMPWSREAFADACHLVDGPKGLGRKAEVFADELMRMQLIEQVARRRHLAREEP